MTQSAVIACGALIGTLRQIISELRLDVHLVAIDPLLHNQPKLISAAVEEQIKILSEEYPRIIVGYADCGTYGQLDQLCLQYGLSKLKGNHCYDVLVGQMLLAAELEQEPGTYLLTDFLISNFELAVEQELGLDRFPYLQQDYFKNYSRLLWLTENPTEALHQKSDLIAQKLKLPIQIIEVGTLGLKSQLLQLLQED